VSPTSEPVRLWRSVLPPVRDGGWAVIHLDAAGFFAAVSDYGDYCSTRIICGKQEVIGVTHCCPGT
jgi:hypothetical protein